MKKFNVKLQNPVSNQHLEELEKRIFFIAEEIMDFKVKVEDKLITQIELVVQDENEEQSLEKKINAVVEEEISKLFIHNAKVIWKSEKNMIKFEKNIFQTMVDRRMIFEVGEGQLCFGKQMMTLMDALDDKFRKIAIEDLDGREYRYPTLIPTKTLEKCGYFDSFPHMLMFVTRLHSDVDIYKSFLEDYESGVELCDCALHNCRNMDYCLPPTMCYHTYNQLQGQNLDEINQVITAVGKSFRHESKYHKTIERLWDFTIREIVFLGEKDYVLNCRKKYMEKSFEFVKELGLMAHSEVASDPFFCNAETAAKILNQRMMELKYELRVNIDEKKTIAAGSFNFHEKFFGENFDITHKDSETIYTGCVGIGLERLAYAFVCQHGLEVRNWPRFSDKLNILFD